MSKALAKFWPSSWLVPICSALPSPIIASQVSVLMAPAKRSLAVLRPTSTGMASTFDHEVRVDLVEDPRGVGARRRPAVAWAVWPSCQRNSLVRRNRRGRSSQRTTLAHWFSSSGRSR